MSEPQPTPDLAPCPFCPDGGEPYVSTTGTPLWVTCVKCGCDGPLLPIGFNGSNDQARQWGIKKWNTRYEEKS